MSPRHLIAALLVAFFWGFNHVAVKVAVEAAPPLWAVTVRFALVAVLLMPFVAAPRGRWREIAALSVVYGTIHLGLISWGLSGMDAATAVIIVQLGTPLTILLGRFFFGERFGLWRWAGVLLAFSGVAFLAGEPRISAPIYFIASIGAVMAWAVGNVQIKKLSDLHPLTISCWTAALSAPQMLILSALTETGQLAVFTDITWPFWAGVLYSAVCSSIIAHSMWNGLLHRYPMSTVAPFNLLVPVIGFIAAILILDEPVTREKMLGGLLTFAGVALIQVRMIIKHVAERDAARTPTA